MTKPVYHDVQSNMFVGVNAFTIDLYEYHLSDGRYYNPTIGLMLDIGDNKESRIFISTEIYNKDPYRAIYFATQSAVMLSSKYHDEVNVIDPSGNLSSEKFSINSIMKNFKLLMQKTEENFSIH